MESWNNDGNIRRGCFFNRALAVRVLLSRFAAKTTVTYVAGCIAADRASLSLKQASISFERLHLRLRRNVNFRNRLPSKQVLERDVGSTFGSYFSLIRTQRLAHAPRGEPETETPVEDAGGGRKLRDRVRG